MTQQNTGVSLPAGFGGLTRFKESYETKFNLKPTSVIVFVILIILFRISLSLFL